MRTPLPSLLSVAACFLLAQCNHLLDPSIRPLTNQDAGQIISERRYEIGGRRMVEYLVLVRATPRLETRLISKPEGSLPARFLIP